MISFPNAKINLGLKILRKRKDGFHDIQTIMFPITFSDILEIVPSENNGLEFSHSGIEIPGDPDTNLCCKAYSLFRTRYPVSGVKMHLHKVIPPGSGLGGGSSDAAFTLKMLNELFNKKVEEDELLEMAAQLGSDCPFFIHNKAVLGEGRGEVMKEVDLHILDGKTVLLVLPCITVSTAWAYSQISPSIPEFSLHDIISENILDWKKILVNDFEKPVYKTFPALKGIRDKLYEMGAVYASMSGSGSAVYGIFNDLPGDIQHHFQDEKVIVTPLTV